MKVHLSLAGSSVLYHLTSMSNAANIAAHDKFFLSPMLDGEVEERKGVSSYFYLSLARTIHNAFFATNIDKRQDFVIFVLDGQKLNANNRIRPIDFFHFDKTKYDESTDETEDRLFSAKSSIPCFKFVKEIHYSAVKSKAFNTQVHTLLTEAEKRGVPCFRYDNIDAFKRLDKRKALAPHDTKGKPTKVAATKHSAKGAEIRAWWHAVELSPGAGDKETQFLKGVDAEDKSEFEDVFYKLTDPNADNFLFVDEDEEPDPEAHHEDVVHALMSAMKSGARADHETSEKLMRHLRNNRMLVKQLATTLMNKWAN